MKGFSRDWFRKLALLTPAPYKPWRHSLRISTGTSLPMLAGVLTGDIKPFLYMALGAFLTEVTVRLGPYRERFRMIAISTAISATGCLIGPLIAGHGPLTFAVLMLVGFFSGIISSYGAAFSTGALHLLVLAIVHASTAGAMPPWQVAAWFVAGAVFVSAMLAIGAVADRDRPERRLRAGLLRALASFARAQTGEAAEAARRAVTDQTKAAYAMLIEKRSHNAGRTRDMARTANMLSLVNQLTMAIISARDEHDDLTAVADMLNRMAEAHETRGPQPAIAGEGEPMRLCGLLSDALWKTKQTENAEPAGRRHIAPRVMLVAAARKLVIGREVVTSALRLSLCIGLAEIAGRFVSSDHAYWVPITIAIIMKPDFGSVFVRAIHRSIGTIIGVLIATALIAIVPDKVGLVVAIAVLCAIQPFAALRSYAARVVFLTPVILLMIDIAVPAPPLHYGVERLYDTLAGAAIVLVFGYLIWPRSQSVQLKTGFAAAISAVTGFLAAASGAREETIAETEFAAYRKLSDLRTQLQRVSAEPPPAGREAAAWFPAVVGAERLCDAISAYTEGQKRGDATPEPQRITLAERALNALETFDATYDPGPMETPAQSGRDRFSAVETEIGWLASYLRGLLSPNGEPASPSRR